MNAKRPLTNRVSQITNRGVHNLAFIFAGFPPVGHNGRNPLD